MTHDASLEDLFLGYCKQLGALVEPPVFNTYEVLLPEEVADRWGIDAHQQFTFTRQGEKPPDGGAVILLHYGHPLVETMVEELRATAANGLFFINNVRLEKPNLFAVIEKTFALPNAKLFSLPAQSVKQRLYHYVRFNFKASLIADEKRELILPVWMHVQTGYSVKATEIERLASLDIENLFPNLPLADSLILPEKYPLGEESLQALLERSSQFTRRELGDTLQNMQKRLGRFLELDRARLSQYYDDLKKDAERRLQRAEDDRRPGIETKIAAIENERQVKLADAEQKYRLRIELDLANLAVIAQPKLDLIVEIKKRSVTIQRRVTWDPLLHIVEPMVCDVCGLPGYELHLCENGHLAHTDCLAPQCVECKRTYCQNCLDHLHTCVVCDRPICTHSMVRCPECQRITCHEHDNLCHAADGEPQRVALPPVLTGEKITKAEVSSPSAQPVPQELPAASRKKEKPARSAPVKPLQKKVPALTQSPVGERAEIYFGSSEPMISVFIMVKKRELATRSWVLTEEGIVIHCQCEKLLCKEDRMIYRPFPDDEVENQLKTMVQKFIREYRVPERKIQYFRIRGKEPFKALKLEILGKWKDSTFLQTARHGFDNF